MAMLASSVLPMLMQPEVRKGMGKLAKYLLIFGTMGVGILAFILISKKINPAKIVGDWLKKGTTGFQRDIQKGISGFQKDIGKGISGFQRDVQRGVTGFQKDVQRGVTGFQKDIKRGASGFGKDVAKGWTGFWSDIGKGFAGFQKDVAGQLKMQSQKRRQLRRVSKPIARELAVLMKHKGVISLPMVKRMSAVKTSFRKVRKRKVRRVGKQFNRGIKRRRRVRVGKTLDKLKPTGRTRLIAKLMKQTRSKNYPTRNRARIKLRRLGVKI